MNNETCENCKYWENTTGATGECRRHAPKEFSEIASYRGIFPHTHLSDWCGDWEK